MKELFEEAGFETYNPDKRALLHRAETNQYLKINKEKAQYAIERRSGREVNWTAVSSRYILDHIYKVDHAVTTFAAGESKKVAFQISLNETDAGGKYAEIRRLHNNGAYADIFDSVVYLRCQEGTKQGGAWWTEDEKEEIISQLYDIVDRACLATMPFEIILRLP